MSASLSFVRLELDGIKEVPWRTTRGQLKSEWGQRVILWSAGGFGVGLQNKL
jgi:hypothetical protein